jgi:hypothetical protein
MTLYDDYRNTDYLDDVSFIAGSEFTLYFPIYDGVSKVLSPISGTSMKWVLSYYGDPETAILQKNASAYDANTFAVAFTKADTINLGSDIYLEQIQITDSDGKIFRPAQGVVIIRKATPIT